MDTHRKVTTDNIFASFLKSNFSQQWPLAERSGAVTLNNVFAQLSCQQLIILKDPGPVCQLQKVQQSLGRLFGHCSPAKNVSMYSGKSNLSIFKRHSITADRLKEVGPPRWWMSQKPLRSCNCPLVSSHLPML